MNDPYGTTPPPPPPPPPPGDSVSPGMPPEAPGYAPAPPAQGGYPYGAQMVQPPKKKKTGLIIVLILLGLLLCCCVVSVGTFFYIGQNPGVFDEYMGVSTSDDPFGGGDVPGAAVVTPGGSAEGAPGITTVWLEWDEPVDMELELWDASGEEYYDVAYSYGGENVTTGGLEPEYFEFKNYDMEDFSSGEWVISVYFSSLDADLDEAANVTLTLQDSSGQVTTFEKTVKWDPSYDQWHAIRLDASTGSYTLLDEWY